VCLVPAATRRHLYLDRPSYVIPDTAVVRRRFERMHRIFGGEVLDAADRAALMEDGRPVYVLCRQGDGLARVRRALGAGAETVYSDPRHAVVRVRP
jgi:hypothetical protein